MYQSQLYGNEPIIDESNFEQFAAPPVGQSKGLVQRDYGKFPKGYSPYARAAKLDVPPRSEWPALIEQREKSRSRISDILTDAKIPPLNQQSTSNCWANSVVGCAEVCRCIAGLPYVPLSPAFIATTLGRFNGGMGVEAMEVMAEKGAPPTSLYGANANRKTITDEIKQAAAEFKTLEWIELPSTFDQMAGALLLYNAPCELGYNFWGHSVMGCDIVCVNGKFGVRFRNSWGNWGENGFGILMEPKGTPNDLECAFVSTASVKFAA